MSIRVAKDMFTTAYLPIAATNTETGRQNQAFSLPNCVLAIIKHKMLVSVKGSKSPVPTEIKSIPIPIEKTTEITAITTN